ncbi:AraC family transcriptional regulator [Flavobacterium sp. H122]|uniref:AraC family transcriptional regulator n=1 Tax=Flavobacterium sp. H122 TaxID=2529860 RepID=UPI0010AB0079|nr:AraC family transcriptional regulator [Flavobacterium sp. H122]
MKLYLLIFFNFIFTSNYPQSKIFFSGKEYASLQNEIRKSSIDNALIIASKLEKSSVVEQKLFAKATLSYFLQAKGDVSMSDKKMDEAVLLSKTMADSNEKWKSLAYINNYMGLIDWQRRKLSDALVKLQKGIEYSKKTADIKQIIKLEINIATINNEIENYHLAIKSLRKSDKMIEANSFLFDEDEFLISKSALFLNLGKNYEFLYKKNDVNEKYLDSALISYKRAVVYSKPSIINKLRAQNNIAGLYLEQKKYDDAIKIYQNVLVECSENHLDNEFYAVSYNLGYSFFKKKKYDKALLYFEKVDSIFKIDDTKVAEYMKSKYYQSKIYEHLKEYEKATDFASIYLQNLEKSELKLNEEKEIINNIQSNQALKKEMVELKDKYKSKILVKKIGFYSVILIIVFLVYMILKNYKSKKITEARFDSVLNEYRQRVEELKIKNASLEQETQTMQTLPQGLSLDEEKEEEIVKKLKEIEAKKVFLNQDFTLQFVAKKIKTNTTYLSYIVNKNFGKSFSEYANELKINYVINEMISNPKYRKYSTQAIAESVGYKNATSFARSFNKKTGLSPVQFAQKLDSHNLSV